MFKVYGKLFAYVPEKRHLILLSVFLSVASTFAIAGAYYYLYLFFEQLMIRGDPSGSILLCVDDFRTVDRRHDSLFHWGTGLSRSGFPVGDESEETGN